MSRTRFQAALEDFGADFWRYNVARGELHAGSADRARRRQLRRTMAETHSAWLSYIRLVALSDPEPSAAERKAARARSRARSIRQVLDGDDAA